MKNKKIRLGILAMTLVFGMIVIGCDNNTTSGSGDAPPPPPPPPPPAGGYITITGIPATYNGMWAALDTMTFIIPGHVVGGFASIDVGTQTITLVQISDGSVRLPAWIVSADGSTVQRFSGSGTMDGILTIASAQTAIMHDNAHNVITDRYWSTVVFSDGNATLTWASSVPF